jgi:hypothetical protein
MISLPHLVFVRSTIRTPCRLVITPSPPGQAFSPRPSAETASRLPERGNGPTGGRETDPWRPGEGVLVGHRHPCWHPTRPARSAASGGAVDSPATLVIRLAGVRPWTSCQPAGLTSAHGRPRYVAQRRLAQHCRLASSSAMQTGQRRHSKPGVAKILRSHHIKYSIIYLMRIRDMAIPGINDRDCGSPTIATCSQALPKAVAFPP